MAHRLCAAFAAVLLLSACGGTTGTGAPALVEVKAAAGSALIITSIGATLQLAATPKDSAGNAVASAVAWASTDASVATVDATGLVTAAGPGSARISATAGLAVGSATITVAQAADSVAVLPASPTVAVGNAVALSAKVLDALAHEIAGAAVTWSSQNTSVATVSSTGEVTGVAVGTTNVTASSSGKSGTAAVSVTPGSTVPVASVTVTGATAPLASIGETLQLTATAKDAGGQPISGAAFTWRSDSTAVATVSSAGTVTAVANGSANIFAKSGTTESSGFAVTVAQVIHSVAVSPANATMTGSTLQFSAQARDANSQPMTAPGATTWQSSNTAVATIDSNGLATSHGNTSASTTITATITGVNGTTQLSNPHGY